MGEISKELLQKNHDKMRRLYESTCKANDELAKENQRLTEENIFLQKQTENADKRVWIYKKAIQDNIEQSRQVELGMVDEIKILKAEIKENNANNRLGH